MTSANGIRKILVPTDFSEMSDRATEYAVTLARTLKASICLLHVIEAPYPQGVWEFYAAPSEETERKVERTVREDLWDRAARYGAGEVHVTADLRMGTSADEIVTAARQLKVDLIVMATHGRRGLPHLLLGSVAEKVVRLASCPVLAVGANAVAHAQPGSTVREAVSGV